MARCAYCTAMFLSSFENSLQLQVVCTSVRMISMMSMSWRRDRSPIDQIFQETVEIPQLQHIDNMVNISVVGIVQISQVRVVTKTDEIPQSQCIDESINDSGVRAPQVKTVENSQFR